MRQVGPLFLLVFCALLQGFSSAVRADEPPIAIKNVRIGSDEEYTRIVFDASGPVQYQLVRSDDGQAVIVRFIDTVPQCNITDLQLLAPVTAIRANAGNDDVLEVALDVFPAVEVKSFLLNPHEQRGHRLVLDLYPKPPAVVESKPAPAVVVASDPPPRERVTTQRTPGGQQPSSAHYGSAAERPEEASRLDVSGTWEHEWALATDDGDSQKFESLIEPRLDYRFSDKIRLTAIARIRLDGVGDLGPDERRPDNYSSINGPWANNAHAEFSWRELYLDGEWGDAYWRVGKQQVVWGEADGIKVLDVVNPQSFREFILDEFDDSRIPLTTLNMQFPVGNDATLQLLWIPDTTYHELAEVDTPYYITSPMLVPVAPDGLPVEVHEAEVPDNPLDDSDFGGRFSAYLGGWDVSLNYLYHYQDAPVLYQSLDQGPGGVTGTLRPQYERNNLVGGTLSNAFGNFTLRAELAYNTDTFHLSNDISRRGIESSAELATVVGLDWQLAKHDTMLSVQWFQSHLFDYRSSIVREQSEHTATFYYLRNFANETWQFDALALYSLNHEDSMVQLKLNYVWRSNIDLWLGADIFSGDRDGLYGQFKDTDRLLLGIKLGF